MIPTKHKLQETIDQVQSELFHCQEKAKFSTSTTMYELYTALAKVYREQLMRLCQTMVELYPRTPNFHFDRFGSASL